MRRRMISLLTLSLSSLVWPVPSASALFGVGDVVIDPTNLAQNIITATNTLEQINNQVAQLQNEAQMLVNQAENLKRLDHTSIDRLKRLLERIDSLMRDAGDITYEVEASERQYEDAFPDSYKTLSNTEIVEEAADQWRISRDAFRSSILVQSGIVTSITEARDTLTDLVGQSQNATGNLSVAQAGNQLMALSVEQQMQMQQMMAAQYRMIAIEESRRAALEEQARERVRRFRGDGAAYRRN